MPRYLERGGRSGMTRSAAAASSLPPLADSGGSSLRDELDRRRNETRMHVRSSANRAFAATMLYTLSERPTHSEPTAEVVSGYEAIARSRRATAESGLSQRSVLATALDGDAPSEMIAGYEAIGRSRRATANMGLTPSTDLSGTRAPAGSMVDAAIERARQAASEARNGARQADELASQVQATLATLEGPERAIVERGARRQLASLSSSTPDATAGISDTAASSRVPSPRRRPPGRLTASERLASSRLERASRTLNLMRERATMLQLVLQLSRQELELNLQRMRMEAELEIAVAAANSRGRDGGSDAARFGLGEGVDEESLMASMMDDPLMDLDELLMPRHGMPADLRDTYAPPCTYAEAMAADGGAHGEESRLPGSGECLVCQSELLPTDRVRLLPCRHAFHVACVDPWFERSTCCPTCRADVMRESLTPPSGIRHDAPPSPPSVESPA